MIFCFECIKIIEIVNEFLLVGDKYMPKMNLKQQGFNYSACGPFIKNKKKEFQKLKKQEPQHIFIEMN